MRALTVVVASMVAGLPAGASAFTGSELNETAGLRAVDGPPLATHRPISWRVPDTRRGAWRRFTQENPGWRAQWNTTTAIPTFLYGPGLEAPGATVDPTAAEAAAREFVGRYRALVSPGSGDTDLVTASNHWDSLHAIRTVAFAQRFEGLEVIGASVSVRFKNDRLFAVASSALEVGDFVVPPFEADTRDLEARAIDLIADRVEQSILRTPPGDARLLPLVPASGPVRFAVVRRAEVEGTRPTGRWDVYLDAETGEPVASEQTLRFASGTLRMNVALRYPGHGRIDVAAPRTEIRLDDTTRLTDAEGIFTGPGSDALSGVARASGAEVFVRNEAGPEATFSFTVANGGSVVWDARDDELTDAQLITYIAAGEAWAYALGIAPNNGWLRNSRLQANVNIDDVCNAFFDGATINFFRSNRACENTGRLSDVVYHEFGHAFHGNSIIPGAGSFDTPLSEGVSDYFAATINNDSGMGRGFFYRDQALREIDPPDDEARWPEDIDPEVPHTTGLIVAGALWDLRKRLTVSAPTPADGVRETDRLLYAILQRARDIPTTYLEVLAADDDDGDITNGTPNFCDITAAFDAHGLADPDFSPPVVGPIRLERPATGDAVLIAPIQPSPQNCTRRPVTAVEVSWRDRGHPSTRGTVTLTRTATSFVGAIPRPADNTIIQYRTTIRYDDGDREVRPANLADPFFEAYFGDLQPLYCTDFETDPSADGWTSALVAGTARDGANDWQWNSLQDVGAPDPVAAFSGRQVIGNDLGGGVFNGRYQSDITNEVRSPVIDALGFDTVRLQYWRWLTVEDGDFDQATIQANGRVLWQNFATGDRGARHHIDQQWRFHDVDLSSALQPSGQVQVVFRLRSDDQVEFGGWTLDDLCIVGAVLPQGPSVCGNGLLEAGEACDDGNDTDSDGCQRDCTVTPRMPACGDGVVDPSEVCDDGNLTDGDGCDSDCTTSLAPSPSEPPPSEPPPPERPPPAASDPCDPAGAACTEEPAPDSIAGCGCSTGFAVGAGPPAALWVLLLVLLRAAFVLRRRP